MNIINQLLIIIILFFLINYLTDGQIIEFIKKIIFNKETFISDIDKLDNTNFNLYRFLNNMVSLDINDMSNKSPQQIATPDTVKFVITNINKIFNSKGYIFNNITLPTNIYYYQSYKGKDFIPFNFQTNISFNNNNLGVYTINIKCFLREDVDYYDVGKTGYLIIQNIKLITIPNNIQLNESYELSKTINDNIEKETIQMKETFNNIQMKEDFNNIKKEDFNNIQKEEFNNIFIKTDDYIQDNNDIENSLIPTVVDI